MAEDALHDGLLVSFADETTLDAESLVSYRLAAIIRDFFHPFAPLSLLQVTFDFQVAADTGELYRLLAAQRVGIGVEWATRRLHMSLESA